MRIKLFYALECTFLWLAESFESARQAIAICPQCGRNRYTGAPCIK